MLGSSETIGRSGDLFAAIDAKQRLYKRNGAGGTASTHRERTQTGHNQQRTDTTARSTAQNFERPTTGGRHRPGIREPLNKSMATLRVLAMVVFRDRTAPATGRGENSDEPVSTYEAELQSTNEELQSANEELTTSKEEMQSMNEELQTINSELRSKLDDLALAQSDVKNVLNSIEIAVLFLDKQLLVRRYTDRAAKMLSKPCALCGCRKSRCKPVMTAGSRCPSCLTTGLTMSSTGL